MLQPHTTKFPLSDKTWYEVLQTVKDKPYLVFYESEKHSFFWLVFFPVLVLLFSLCFHLSIMKLKITCKAMKSLFWAVCQIFQNEGKAIQDSIYCIVRI